MEEVTLQEVLLAREERVERQNQMREKFSSTLLSFTMNIAGPVKTSPLILRAFQEGKDLLLSLFSSEEILSFSIWEEKTGPLLLLATTVEPETAKRRCLLSEEEHPLGRLFDFDVLSADGKKISRNRKRKCLVCEEEAFLCSSRRRHSAEELQKKTNEILTDYFLEKDASLLARFCHEALLFELHVTPKPGLVDENNNGSHKDMDLPLFEKSAESLYPLWSASFRRGFEGKEEKPKSLFSALRALGLEAEKKMLSVTGGVNTHKGALFSFCLFCGAAGKAYNGVGLPSGTEICETVIPLAEISLLDFQKAGFPPSHTGARGEAAKGFPLARGVALPILKELFEKGTSFHIAGGAALLSLIARGEDTNLFARGGKSGAEWAKNRAREILKETPIPAKETLLALDREFIKRNLSPGGSADLLALSYLMWLMEKKKDV